jgi:hypothetical protein
MSFRSILTASLLLIAVTHPLQAQDTSKAKPETMGGMADEHMMSPWKEMNTFHRVLAATWHPAAKNDLKPLREKARELWSTADSWASSKPPAMPASCASEAVRTATAKVLTGTKDLVALIDGGVDDARLKAALKTVHDSFEVAEKGCAGHGHGEPLPDE